MGHGIIHFDTSKCVKMDNFFAFFMPKSVQPIMFFFIFAMNHKVIPSSIKLSWSKRGRSPHKQSQLCCVRNLPATASKGAEP